MSELLMFIGTVGFMVVSMLFVSAIAALLPDHADMRLGLWLNGISGEQADEIIEWHERKR
jgi:hypothetical protein